MAPFLSLLYMAPCSGSTSLTTPCFELRLVLCCSCAVRPRRATRHSSCALVRSQRRPDLRSGAGPKQQPRIPSASRASLDLRSPDPRRRVGVWGQPMSCR
uniref:Uncharacterized protein n=1 Tax=Zea mays TaxID=4577 RepID=B6TZZ6_MAIZE|nr:hypothetical protein [Zea mays]